jgi:thiol-disulfide isomerase/thioredoxin
MTVGAWIALAVLLAATAFGVWRRRTDGHFRGGVPPTREDTVVDQALPLDADGHLPSAEESDWGGEDPHAHEPVRTQLGDAVPAEAYGERATLVQFSSAFCAPCRVARRVLGEVAEVVPGVTHVEVDAESHLDVVRALGIVRTPTTIVVDGVGREASRAVGAPRKEQVLAALGDAV